MNEPTEARLQLAGHWLQIGRPERTLDELQGLWGDAALDYRAYLFRGAALHALDRNAEAIDVLRDGLSHHGPFLPLLQILGAALRVEGRLPEAEAALLQGLSLDPNEPDLLLGYAMVCLSAGQAEKANALVERAAAFAPESPAVSAARAQVAFALGKDKDMHRHSEEALSADPDDPHARALHGTSAMLTGDANAGYRSLASAAAANPGDPDLREAARAARLANHPLMRPLRPFQRFNPLAVWIGAVAVIYGLRLLGLAPLAFVAAIGWFGFCVYSWVVPPLLRRWLDRGWGR
ncbi:Tetratricopeptide domain protein [Kribbella flavida DSM 17836]|uniref:Tetratricopeptide domain protein n=1 Tax=Kribbella flavida (strain DSM 17836 / JCM 10339 / NBRC 14399) TaxID=479435 RepID=D2PKW7_KRIFD|nr:tetratricopeptide repeat protein [Kribbella flavida]ADB32434.1 Tetratricopeptide domain protein [Kribbella flavida DSM 17836]